MSVYKLCFSVANFYGPAYLTLLEDGVVSYYLTQQQHSTLWTMGVPTTPSPPSALFTSTTTPIVNHYIWFDNDTNPTLCYYSTDDGSTVAHTFVVTADARGAVLKLTTGNSGETNSHFNCVESSNPASHVLGDTYTENGESYAYTFWSEQNAAPEYYPELCRFDDTNHPSLFTGTLSTGYDSFIFRCFADPTLLGSSISVSSIVATVDGSSTPTQMARVSSGSDYWETALLTLVQPTKTLTGVGTYYIPHTVKFTATLSDNSTLESDTYYFVSLLKNGPTTAEKTFYQGVYDADSHWICDTPTGYYNDSGSWVILSEGNDAWVSLVEGAWTSLVTNLLTVSAVGSYSSTVGYIPSDFNVLFYGEGTAVILQKQLTISGTTVTSTRVYNGGVGCDVTAGSLSGVLPDEVGEVTVTATGEYENKNYGTSKKVTVTYTLSGSKAGNYLAPERDENSFTASITKLRLRISGTTVANKSYDGTTTASAAVGQLTNVCTDDSVNVAVSSATFADKNVGTNKNVTVVYSISGDTSNYYKPSNGTLKANITARPITISNIQSQSN